MVFLIDGSGRKIAQRRKQAPHLVGGQLLTPLTQYRRCEEVFAVDNGAYKCLDVKGFTRILSKQWDARESCLFVTVPDKVCNHKKTLEMWYEYEHLADGYKKAFAIQDGFDFLPEDADAIFIGGSSGFKDSWEVEQIVAHALSRDLHVHVGRVNGFSRFYKFHSIGAHTCDGSGISIQNHMIDLLAEKLKTIPPVSQINLPIGVIQWDQ